MDVSDAPASIDKSSEKPNEAVQATETWNGEQYTVIKEGQANILYPAGHQVFYNPVQEYNRDMSVMMLRLFAEEWHGQQGKPVRILEALAATGLRSVRYAKEIEGLDFVMANDLDPKAVEAIHRNREYNGIEETKLKTTLSDAAFLMHKMKNDMSMQNEARVESLSVVDLDPYGGASPFLDGATSLICDGGLLAVTCTDLAVLCGNYAEACWAKYGAMPPKRTEYCHEMALRIILGSIASHAARHHRHIVPVMSMFADFYVRVFVRVYKHGGELKKVPSKMGYIMQCTCCDAREVQKIGKYTEPTPGNVRFSQGYAPVVDQKCPHCEGAWKMGGPMWMEPMHDRAVLERALAHLEQPDAAAKYGTHRRMLGTITNMLDELPDVPFFYTVSQLANTLHLQTPKLDAFRSAIMSLGYRVSATHCAAGAVKTDAPTEAIYDVMRSWHQTTPAKLDGQDRTPAYKILSKPPTRIANFTIVEAAKSITHARNGDKLGRFPIHPPNWGPGSRAGRKRDATSMADELASRRKEGQGHRVDKKKAKLSEVPRAQSASTHSVNATSLPSDTPTDASSSNPHHNPTPSSSSSNTMVRTSLSSSSFTPPKRQFHKYALLPTYIPPFMRASLKNPFPSRFHPLPFQRPSTPFSPTHQPSTKGHRSGKQQLPAPSKPYRVQSGSITNWLSKWLR